MVQKQMEIKHTIGFSLCLKEMKIFTLLCRFLRYINTRLNTKTRTFLFHKKLKANITKFMVLLYKRESCCTT